LEPHEVLSGYLTRTNQLLQYPVATPPLYATADLTSWINEARGQTAGEGECIRVMGTIATVIGQRAYNFSAINLGIPSLTGAQGAIHVRTLHYGVASGQKRVTSRNWEWFSLYCLNNPIPVPSFPKTWSQYGQGSAGIGSITNVGAGTLSSGSFYIDPPPDAIYTLYLDCVAYPIALAADTDVEAIPYLWTDAVPYYAAFLALDSSQSGQRRADAQRRFEQYQQFVARARQFANPDVLKWQYQQSKDPAMLAKYGLKPNAGAGGGQ
jgi:hypothetical protein